MLNNWLQWRHFRHESVAGSITREHHFLNCGVVQLKTNSQLPRQPFRNEDPAAAQALWKWFLDLRITFCLWKQNSWFPRRHFRNKRWTAQAEWQTICQISGNDLPGVILFKWWFFGSKKVLIVAAGFQKGSLDSGAKIMFFLMKFKFLISVAAFQKIINRLQKQIE